MSRTRSSRPAARSACGFSWADPVTAPAGPQSTDTARRAHRRSARAAVIHGICCAPKSPSFARSPSGRWRTTGTGAWPADPRSWRVSVSGSVRTGTTSIYSAAGHRPTSLRRRDRIRPHSTARTSRAQPRLRLSVLLERSTVRRPRRSTSRCRRVARIRQGS